MARPKYAQKKDRNHSEIVLELVTHGVEVVDVSGAGKLPDLLTRFDGIARMLEIKTDESGNRYTFDQLEFIGSTKFPVRFVTTKEDAVLFARTGRGALTASEKERLLAMVIKGGEKLYTPKQVRDALKA